MPMHRADDHEPDAQPQRPVLEPLTLGEETRQRLVERVLDDWAVDGELRSTYLQQREKGRKWYEGIHPAKTFPHPNASNVDPGMIAIHADTVHANLMEAIWSEDRLQFRALEASDVEGVERVNRFMRWDRRVGSGLRQIIDTFLHNLSVDGTAIAKTRFERVWDWVASAVPILKQGERQIDPTTKRTKTKLEWTYQPLETVVTEIIDLEDLAFDPDDPRSVNDGDHVIHRLRYTAEDLEGLARQGFFHGVDEALLRSVEAFPETTPGPKEAIRAVEGTASDLTGSTNPHRRKIEVLEAYLRFDANDDGFPEELVTWIALKARRELRTVPLELINRQKRRPFVLGQLFLRPNRRYGVGVAEKLKNDALEQKIIHDQRLDAATAAIWPHLWATPEAAKEAQRKTLGPMTVYVTTNPQRDVRYAQAPVGNVAIAFQEEKLTVDLAERKMGIGATRQGVESALESSRRTASEVLTVESKAQMRSGAILGRVEAAVAELFSQRLQYWQQFLPPGLGTRVLGEDGAQLFPEPETLSRETIAGRFDAVFLGESTAFSKGERLQKARMALADLSNSPFVANNPAGAWQLAADYYLELFDGLKRPEEVLGPKPPNVFDAMRTAEAEHAELQEGRVLEPMPGINFMRHLIQHLQWEESPTFVQLPPEYKQNFRALVAGEKLLFRDALAQQALQATRAQGQEQLVELFGRLTGATERLASAQGQGGLALPPAAVPPSSVPQPAVEEEFHAGL